VFRYDVSIKSREEPHESESINNRGAARRRPNERPRCNISGSDRFIVY